MFTCKGRKKTTDLFFRQLLAPPLLANLMTLIVPTRGTVTTIIFPLTPDAFTAPLPLLLDLLVDAAAATTIVRVHRTVRLHLVVALEARRAGDGGHLARALGRHLHVAGRAVALRRALQAGGAHFPPLLLPEVVARRGVHGAAPVELLVQPVEEHGVLHHRGHGVLELRVVQPHVLNLQPRVLQSGDAPRQLLQVLVGF